LETARLVLRELQDSDDVALARELANYNISRNTSSIPHPYTCADAVEFIARQRGKTSASVKKVIALKRQPHTLIGSVRLHIDPAMNTCELGYWIAEQFWGKGYATEAARYMVNHAFAVLNFSDIVADYNTDNPASGRVLQRLGFTETGTGESFSAAQGKMVPVTFVRLARAQWER
jgi:[ribosomal protein S5]-alanine N-acetyltransferase